jgi:hypothetical protein
MGKQKIQVDAEYGWWTVVEYRGGRSLCRCTCGREVAVLNSNLTSGQSTKCKYCATKITANNREHGPTRKVLRHIPAEVYQRLATITVNVLRRCTDATHPQWKDYGGRGIEVYLAWLENRWEFIKYLATLPCYLNPSLVLDRKDNDGNYEPGNLRFVTRSVSSLNRRRFAHKFAHDHKGRFTKATLEVY